MRISLKYCGSCNPRLSLRQVADLLNTSAKRLKLDIVPFSSSFDLAVFLCGCSRACAVKPDLKNKAKHYLIIAGESLNGKAVPAEKLLAAIEETLVSLNQKNL